MLKWHIITIIYVSVNVVLAQKTLLPLIDSQEEIQHELLPIENSNDMAIMTSDDDKAAEETDTEDLSSAEQRWGWGGRKYGGGWGWRGLGYGGKWGWGGLRNGGGWGYGKGWSKSHKRYWG